MLDGIVTELKLAHASNAYQSMLVAPSGIVMDVKLVHVENAHVPILVTPSGIEYAVCLLPAGYWINSVLSALNNTPSIEI